jgi:hypothetical protein
MKKITELALNRLVIDPSIGHQNTLDDMIRQYKIDIISYKDNEEIILNLYYTLRIHFSDAIVHEVLKSALTEEEIKRIDRDYKLGELLKLKI